jgi:hypothetical protein
MLKSLKKCIFFIKKRDTKDIGSKSIGSKGSNMLDNNFFSMLINLKYIHFINKLCDKDLNLIFNIEIILLFVGM